MVRQNPHMFAYCQHLIHDAMLLTQRDDSCIMPQNAARILFVQVAVRRARNVFRSPIQRQGQRASVDYAAIPLLAG